MTMTTEGERMARRIWTVDVLLRTWGEWYEYGRLPTALRAPGADCGGVVGMDEGHLAALYVEGLNPPCLALARAFVLAKPALVHVYAKLRLPETFDVPLAPGQSDLTRAITCNAMVNDYRAALEQRMTLESFLPSKFEAE
jgi:hypothetical protein